MQIYAFIYAISAVLLIIGGYRVFRIHRNDSGFFFMLFALSAAVWLLIYYFFFANIFSPDALLTLSRSAYALSIIGEYSLILFIWNFRQWNSEWLSRKTVAVLIGFTILFSFYVFTSGIISGLTYDTSSGVYREIYGTFLHIHSLFTIGFIPLLIYTSTKRISEQNFLNRTRLRMIAFAIGALMFTLIILQFVLPLFGIWIFEKEITILFVLFVLSVVYITRRYYFSGIGSGVGRGIVYLMSFLITVTILNASRLIFGANPGLQVGYWMDKDTYSFIETFIVVVTFLVVDRLLSTKILGIASRAAELKNSINSLNEEMSGIVDEELLVAFLTRKTKDIFKTSTFEILKFDGVDSELGKFFNKNPREKIFINDMIFIEENSRKFNKAIIQKELGSRQFIAIPISGVWRGTSPRYGAIVLGPKSFGDFYDANEISALRGLSFSIGRQLKYIDMYHSIQDLSENLDKKVDEKTIEYNKLLSRQKEFISIISHEIKAPVANAIFQADSMLDDINNGELSKEWMVSEMNILNEQLARMGELTSRLFSMQYFETRDVKLFRESIHIGNLLKCEVGDYARANKDIKFISEFDELEDSTKFISVDKIQFKQVISNLLQNAIKFSNKRGSSKIIVSAGISSDNLHVSIEDGGEGFKGIDSSRIFERYSTGEGPSIGLGLGLYLCKNIVELHGGTIDASTSERLGGAKFSISIPV